MKPSGFGPVRGAVLEALLVCACLAAAGSVTSARAAKDPAARRGKKVVAAATDGAERRARAGGTEAGLASWILAETATSTSEFRINTYTTQNQSRGGIASDAAGNFVVVWVSEGQDGSFTGIFGQRFAGSGAPLGIEFPVNLYTTSYQSWVSVARADGGAFVVTWQSALQDFSDYGVFGRRFDAFGAPLGGEFRVNAYTTYAQVLPSVASDAVGDFVVVWERFGTDSGIFGQRFASDGAPSGGEFRVDTSSALPTLPAVASNPSGGFVVVWQSRYPPNGNFTIRARRYSSAGAPVGGEFPVSSLLAPLGASPAVACSSSGEFVITWQSPLLDGSSYGVFGRRFDSGGVSLGVDFQVNTTTAGGQGSPAISFGRDGGFVVSWQGDFQDGSMFGIFGQRYDGYGTPVGPEFAVNLHTTGSQVFPSVVGRSGSSFVVVWQGDGQDGSLTGIFGRRFCSNLTSVTVDVTGQTTICPSAKGGTATVTDVDGGVPAHQWGYRMLPGGSPIPIDGQTGSSYVINGANFPGPGFYYLFCFTNPECGTPTFSNDVVVIVAADMTAPLVEPPRPATFTQTLCN